MADVYKFKEKLKELETIIWRDIEIMSVSSVAKLGYSILVAFESTAGHLVIKNDTRRSAYERILCSKKWAIG